MTTFRTSGTTGSRSNFGSLTFYYNEACGAVSERSGQPRQFFAAERRGGDGVLSILYGAVSREGRGVCVSDRRCAAGGGGVCRRPRRAVWREEAGAGDGGFYLHGAGCAVPAGADEICPTPGGGDGVSGAGRAIKAHVAKGCAARERAASGAKECTVGIVGTVCPEATCGERWSGGDAWYRAVCAGLRPAEGSRPGGSHPGRRGGGPHGTGGVRAGGAGGSAAA